VEPLRGAFDGFDAKQLSFLCSLSNADALVAWLLEKDSTDEFNRLLKVVRESTDEPRLLSSIASLVHVRTLLGEALYTKPPYGGLDEILSAFGKLQIEEADTAHLVNITANFEGLMDVFVKQTRSPGIKAVLEVRDIGDGGNYVFRSSHKPNETLKYEGEVVGKDGEKRSTSYAFDYLLDLRDKVREHSYPWSSVDPTFLSLLPCYGPLTTCATRS